MISIEKNEYILSVRAFDMRVMKTKRRELCTKESNFANVQMVVWGGLFLAYDCYPQGNIPFSGSI